MKEVSEKRGRRVNKMLSRESVRSSSGYVDVT